MISAISLKKNKKVQVYQFKTNNLNVTIWFGSLFNNILTFMGYLMPKSSLLKNSGGTF